MRMCITPTTITCTAINNNGMGSSRSAVKYLIFVIAIVASAICWIQLHTHSQTELVMHDNSDFRLINTQKYCSAAYPTMKPPLLTLLEAPIETKTQYHGQMDQTPSVVETFVEI